jgi:hypothetical protein
MFPCEIWETYYDRILRIMKTHHLAAQDIHLPISRSHKVSDIRFVKESFLLSAPRAGNIAILAD